MLVPHSDGHARRAAQHNFERWIWRVRCEIFVGINVDIRGMIDGQQSHLVEVDRFLERFHETKTENLLGLSHLPWCGKIHATGGGMHRSFALLRMTRGESAGTFLLVNNVAI